MTNYEIQRIRAKIGCKTCYDRNNLARTYTAYSCSESASINCRAADEARRDALTALGILAIEHPDLCVKAAEACLDCKKQSDLVNKILSRRLK